jgi:hypothetical protein
MHIMHVQAGDGGAGDGGAGDGGAGDGVVGGWLHERTLVVSAVP